MQSLQTASATRSGSPIGCHVFVSRRWATRAPCRAYSVWSGGANTALEFARKSRCVSVEPSEPRYTPFSLGEPQPRNRKLRASGMKTGNQWPGMRVGSMRVAATASPPRAGMRYNGPEFCGLKTISPFVLHVPPWLPGADANATGGPPATSIRFSCPLEKNPIDRLSGDQKGRAAPSVPASGRALSTLRGRSQICGVPSGAATNRKVRPSGESVNSPRKLSAPGVAISMRISVASAGARRKYSAEARKPIAIAPRTAAPTAAIHPTRPRQDGL